MAAKALKTLWLLHGVNLDMLGRRDPAVYGSMTLAELEAYVARHGEAHGFTVRSFQTNHEGEFIEKLHQLVIDGADAAIINPGAWTHYSYALARRPGAGHGAGSGGAPLGHREPRSVAARSR